MVNRMATIVLVHCISCDGSFVVKNYHRFIMHKYFFLLWNHIVSSERDEWYLCNVGEKHREHRVLSPSPSTLSFRLFSLLLSLSLSLSLSLLVVNIVLFNQ